MSTKIKMSKMRVAKHLAMSSLASYIANQLHVTIVIETKTWTKATNFTCYKLC